MLSDEVKLGKLNDGQGDRSWLSHVEALSLEIHLWHPPLVPLSSLP